MQRAQEISIRPETNERTGQQIWRVTYDGRILGDSRGYATKETARNAALAIVNNEHAAAATERRHANKVWRPY